MTHRAELPTTTPENQRKTRAFPWPESLGLFAWGAGLAAWTWARTGDILGDFGNELYVAWQLSRGRVLYRDIAYPFGPLAPYLNGLWMRLFGNGLSVILTANLAVLVLTTTMLFRLVRLASDRFTAFMGCFIFLSVFAFGSATRITNYNFLTPYTHAITYGFLLCLGMLNCLANLAGHFRIRDVLVAALLTGLSFLTKPEVFSSCIGTFAVGMGLILWRQPKRRMGWAIFAAIAGIGVPILCAIALLATRMSGSEAIKGAASGWQFINNPYIKSTPFYRDGLGILDVRQSLLAMMGSLVGYVVVIVSLLGAALAAGKRKGIAIGLGLAVGGAYCAAAYYRPAWSVGGDRGLIVFVAATVAYLGWRLIEARPNWSERSLRIRFFLAIFAMLLLSKMFLNARTYHYGFVLAAPAALLAIIALVYGLPSLAQKWGGSAIAVRVGASGLLVAIAACRLVLTNAVMKERTLVIPLAFGGSLHGRAADGAGTEDAGARDAVEWLKLTPPATTVAAIPDGAGILYASGRADALPYNDLHPIMVNIAGESNVLRAIIKTPPDVLLLVQVQYDGFGTEYFGRDYAMQISGWIRSHYRYAATFGERNTRFSVDMWLRR